MRVAALYDVHGNLPALEAVLEEVERVGAEVVVVGGDVMPGPMAAACLARLRALALPTRFVSGNGEREVLAARDGQASTTLPSAVVEAIRWNAAALDEDAAAFVRGWRATQRLTVDGVGDVLFCHATPRSDTQIFTRETPDAVVAPMLEGAAADLVVCGHTHMAFDRLVGERRVVNAGSVGMPFGRPGAHWLLLDGGVELRRTDYDLEAAAARVRESGYPQAEEFAERHVLSPPSEAEMLKAFSSAPG